MTATTKEEFVSRAIDVIDNGDDDDNNNDDGNTTATLRRHDGGTSSHKDFETTKKRWQGGARVYQRKRAHSCTTGHANLIEKATTIMDIAVDDDNNDEGVRHSSSTTKRFSFTYWDVKPWSVVL